MFHRQGLSDSSWPSFDRSTGPPGSNSRVIEQRRAAAYPTDGEITSDWPSKVMDKDCKRTRVVALLRTNSEESEVSETDTWPERENVDLVEHTEPHDYRRQSKANSRRIGITVYVQDV